jgi:hypothetical protein
MLQALFVKNNKALLPLIAWGFTLRENRLLTMLSINQLSPTVALTKNIDWFIAAQVADCQEVVHKILAPLLATAESDQASLPQRIVTDRLQYEGTDGLPNHHPLHWFQSHLEFQIQGVLEYSSMEAAQAGLKAILGQIKPQIVELVAVDQVKISRFFDQEVLRLQQGFAVDLADKLHSKSIVISEYINSYVPVPYLLMRSIDRFRYTLDGKRWESPSLIIEGQRNSAPWYLMGLGKKDHFYYQVSVSAIIAMVDESVARAFRHMREQISEYVELELCDGIDRLFSSVV